MKVYTTSHFIILGIVQYNEVRQGATEEKLTWRNFKVKMLQLNIQQPLKRRKPLFVSSVLLKDSFLFHFGLLKNRYSFQTSIGSGRYI